MVDDDIRVCPSIYNVQVSFLKDFGQNVVSLYYGRAIEAINFDMEVRNRAADDVLYSCSSNIGMMDLNPFGY